MECDPHIRLVHGCHPETQPFAFADLVLVDAVILFFFNVDVEFVTFVCDLGRPQLVLVKV